MRPRPYGMHRYVGIGAALAAVLAVVLVAGFLDRGHGDGPGASPTEWAAGPSLPALPAVPPTSGSTPSSRSRPSRPPGPGVDGGTRRATRAESIGVVRIVVSRGDAGATATGMVLTSAGRVLTNRHVVAGASRIEVTVIATGRRYAARLVGSDRRHDVAVLRIVGAAGLRTVHRDRTALRIGQHVTAVGDGGGSPTHLTAAPGRVRSLDRRFIAPATAHEQAEALNGVDEVTCDVSLGDSGGPTYDRWGAVVAMTTGMVRYGREPVGIVIPISTVMRSVGRIVG